MRGKLRGEFGHVMLTDITPACAGKTVYNMNIIIAVEDHPRVCGENWIRQRSIDSQSGSPPRVRGKRVQQEYKLTGFRITPACAGKTSGLINR